MILCTFSDFRSYARLHPTFARIWEVLEARRLDTLPEGRWELEGDRLFLSASPVARTRSAYEAMLEVHRRYLDVQVILRGVDRMGWRPTASCRNEIQAYDPDRDIVFYGDAPSTFVEVPAGHLIVFFPEDAHAPLIGSGETIHKVVFKVRIEEEAAEGRDRWQGFAGE